ncbi:MAG: hypothetical protein Q7N50_04005, partial [Armatimonadota bacterium]|nr:hypothetical protein [Armatimonadota bacterium]
MQISPESEEKVRFQRLLYGFAYGMAAGLAFATALWGYDNYILWQHHGLLPWTKLVIGGALSMAICGLAGWLT